MDKINDMFTKKYFVCIASKNDYLFKNERKNIHFNCKIKDTYENALQYKKISLETYGENRFIVETRGPLLLRQFQVEKIYKNLIEK